MSAAAAQNSRRVSFALRPDFRLMSRVFRVTFKARKPLLAALEFDSDDVNRTSVMGAPRLLFNVCSKHFYIVNHHQHTEINSA